MPSGVVKWFNETKGYGFIRPDDGGRDIFVHISAVRRSGLSYLDEGQEVEFEIRVDHKGRYSATNLRNSFGSIASYTSYGSAPLPVTQSNLSVLIRDQEERAERTRKNISFINTITTKVLVELSEFRSLIFETSGWLLKRHTYSQEQLLHHSTLAKIRALCGTIESNMASWRTIGHVEYVVEQAYEASMRRIAEAIDDLTKIICQRRPTYWEIIRDTLLSLVTRATLYLTGRALLRIGTGSP